jgi:hypothetical protein
MRSPLTSGRIACEAFRANEFTRNGDNLCIGKSKASISWDATDAPSDGGKILNYDKVLTYKQFGKLITSSL